VSICFLVTDSGYTKRVNVFLKPEENIKGQQRTTASYSGDALYGILVMGTNDGVVLRTYFGHVHLRRLGIVKYRAGVGGAAG
jgi:hypothetical protein